MSRRNTLNPSASEIKGFTLIWRKEDITPTDLYQTRVNDVAIRSYYGRVLQSYKGDDLVDLWIRAQILFKVELFEQIDH